ncbi:YcaO-like family protein [Herbaspirillum sp. GCM10030257]|uniref:YcaO-like family protein n=1 Tax=Herbaspirillum sp. GCM10030257 TaxID=3273393 RepID=UPI0036140130
MKTESFIRGKNASLDSGNIARGACTLPYARLRDGAQALVPVNIIGNRYVSNGMATGNSVMEACSQVLS